MTQTWYQNSREHCHLIVQLAPKQLHTHRNIHTHNIEHMIKHVIVSPVVVGVVNSHLSYPDRCRPWSSHGWVNSISCDSRKMMYTSTSPEAKNNYHGNQLTPYQLITVLAYDCRIGKVWLLLNIDAYQVKFSVGKSEKLSKEVAPRFQ